MAGTIRAGKMAACSPPAHPLRVVVADNDPGAVAAVVTDLGLEGHEIVGRCLDGRDRDRPVPGRAPLEVAIIDHRMPPGPHGLEVAERLAVEAPEVRVIVFTNYQDAELIRAVRESGATYCPRATCEPCDGRSWADPRVSRRCVGSRS